MSQENLQEEEKQIGSKSSNIQALLRESREILKEKLSVSDNIKEYKQQLRKAKYQLIPTNYIQAQYDKYSRDQYMAQVSKEKATTSTPALAHNSSMNTQQPLNVLGKRKDRESDVQEPSHDIEPVKESPSKRQKYVKPHQTIDEMNRMQLSINDCLSSNTCQSHHITNEGEFAADNKLSSIVASSALNKDDNAQEETKDGEKQESIILIKNDSNVSLEDKKAMRAQKFQSPVIQNDGKSPQKPITKQDSQDNIQQKQNPEGGRIEDRRTIVVKRDDQVKRTRNLFSNMMKHLEKAKTRLESEKELLGKQEQVVQKVSEKLMKDSSHIQEIQISVIEDRLNQEIDKKRDLERKLIQINEDVKSMKHLEQLRRLSHFIKTETKPQIFWMPAKHTEWTFTTFEKSKQAIEKEIADYKKESENQLQERLKQYDERVQQMNERRQSNGNYVDKSPPREESQAKQGDNKISPLHESKNEDNIVDIKKDSGVKDNLDDFDVDEDEDLDIYALH